MISDGSLDQGAGRPHPAVRTAAGRRPRRRPGAGATAGVACAVAALAVWSAIALAATPPSAPGRQAVADELRRRVEQLRAGGALAPLGEPLGAGEQLAELYERRGFAPVWTDPGAARELLDAVRGAETHGLDPAGYHLAALEARAGARPTAAPAAAELDLARTDALLLLARHLRFGRVEPADREPAPEVDPEPGGETAGIDAEALLAAADLGGALEALAPDHPSYRGLRRALARYRAIRDAGGFPAIGPPAGQATALSRGIDDHSVPALRRRLVMAGDLPPDADVASTVFDEPLEAAVRRFQHRHGLNDDGVVGPATRAEMEVPVEARIEQIRINLERARWVLRDLGDAFVAVNVAGQRVYVVRGGSVVWETRSIVGKTTSRTPTFSATMRYVVLNPGWAVPRSINREVLTETRKDPSYLDRQRFRVLDAAGREVDRGSVDFASYRGSDFPYQFRQEPGPVNALGRVKLMFPNPYSVYLHDTPARGLFAREQRTFSHGCIRVQDPLRLAELVLDDPERWNLAALQAAVDSGATRTLMLERPLPVKVLYWTAAADLHGELHFYRDVYGRDPKVAAALDAR